MRRTTALAALLTLIPATALANWTGTWTGTPNLNLGTNTPTCCSQIANNYTATRLTITLHRTGPGYTITSTGPWNGPSAGPGTATPFVYASSNATLTSNQTGKVVCVGGSLIAGGTYPAWGGTTTSQAYARIRFAGCPIFNKWTVIQIQNGATVAAVIH